MQRPPLNKEDVLNIRDSKGNVIEVTIFESQLSRFLLEHPGFYQEIYVKLINAIEVFLLKNRQEKMAMRCLSNIFYELERDNPDTGSFEKIKINFSLIAADTLVKQCCDKLLSLKTSDVLPPKLNRQTNNPENYSDIIRNSIFEKPQNGMERLKKHLRSENLFGDSNKNRGVVEIADEEVITSRDLGIVEPKYTPESLKNYLAYDNESARFQYEPNKDSLVGKWLGERNLPIIAGTSGSTEQIFSRAMPLVYLSRNEMKTLLLAQSARMVAMGHHSFFECMIVADRYGFKLSDDKKNMLEFYLQCIPDNIRKSDSFLQFIKNEPTATALASISIDSEKMQHTISNQKK